MTKYELTPEFKKLKRGDMIVKFPDGRKIQFSDHEIYIAKQPPIPTKRRKADVYTYKGLSGFYLIDNETYYENDLTLDISVIARSIEEREKKKLILESMMNGQILEFCFYHEPYGYYQGFVDNVTLQGSRTLRHSYEGQIILKLNPYRLPISSNSMTYTIKSGDSFIFDVGVLMPELEIVGSGDVSIKTLNTVTLRNLPSGSVFVNSETKQTYQKGRGNELIFRGDLKANYEYPEIRSGTPITWTGSVESMKINLNWRI